MPLVLEEEGQTICYVPRDIKSTAVSFIPTENFSDLFSICL